MPIRVYRSIHIFSVGMTKLLPCHDTMCWIMIKPFFFLVSLFHRGFNRLLNPFPMSRFSVALVSTSVCILKPSSLEWRQSI